MVETKLNAQKEGTFTKIELSEIINIIVSDMRKIKTLIPEAVFKIIAKKIVEN